MKYFLFPIVLASMVLAGCSSNPNAIEPNDLPDFDASYKVKRLWKEGVGKGVEDSQLSLRPAVTEQQVFAPARQPGQFQVVDSIRELLRNRPAKLMLANDHHLYFPVQNVRFDAATAGFDFR